MNTKRDLFRSLSVVLLVALAAVGALAQQATLIRGEIYDSETGKPIPSANVLLYDYGTTVQVAGVASDLDGVFLLLNLEDGMYDLSIAVLGYQQERVDSLVISRTNPKISLGKIELEPVTLKLNDVSFTVEREHVELSPEKKVYRIGDDVLASSRNVSDVLNAIPSVTVDFDGTVELRGDSNVRILVNGKSSGQMASNAADALQQLSADLVEKVEVITNPSARFDAQGTAGIINLVMKKQQDDGLNGSVNLNTGYPESYGASTNLNYRSGKVNLFLNEGYRTHEMTRDRIINQEYYSNPDFTYLDETSASTGTGWGNNVRLGLDYLPNEKTEWSISGFYDYRDSHNENEVSYLYKDTNGALLSEVIRSEPEEDDDSWYGGQLDYSKSFDDSNDDLSASFNFEHGGKQKNAFLTESELYDFSDSLESDLFQETWNNEDKIKYMFTLDYVNQFSWDSKIEMGVKAKIESNEYDYYVDEQDSLGDWTELENVIDLINYDENIYAGYLTYTNRFGPISLQAGLRAEYSAITTASVSANSTNERNYLDWFPSAFAGYNLTQTNSLQLNYSRRIHRPDHRMLIPFFSYSDSRNIMAGNPDLNPEYTDAVELGHLYYWDKGSISTSVYYRKTDDVIQRWETSQDSVIITMPYNFSTRKSYGIEWVASFNPVRYLSLDANFNLFTATTEGSWDSQELESETESWFARLSARYQVARTYQIVMRFHYHGPHEELQGKRDAMYFLDLGVSYKFLEGDGTLSLNVRDVLDTGKHQNETWTDTFYSYSEFTRSRMIRLSFSYRFNHSTASRWEAPKPDAMHEGPRDI